MVGVGRERIGVEVGAEDDTHPSLFQAETHSSGPGEQVGGEQRMVR